MAFVSVTRLRVRHWRFLPAFALHTARTVRQVRMADGYLDGALLPDRRHAFWTLTLWRDRAAMRAYMAGGAHLKAMPRLLDWCDEASVAHWEQAAATLPDWTEAERRMRGEGRLSKVRHPAATQAGMAFAPPRLTRAAPLPPRA